VQVRLRSAASEASKVHLQLRVSPASNGRTLLGKGIEHVIATGDTQIEETLHVENHRLWDLADPYLYRVSVRVSADGMEGSDERQCVAASGTFAWKGATSG